MVQIIRERQVVEGISYSLCFDWIAPDGKRKPGSGFAFNCDSTGKLTEEYTEPHRANARENYQRCVAGAMTAPWEDGTATISAGYLRELPYRYVIPAAAKCESCGGEAEMSRHCGAWVCSACDHHQGLARCYCGWRQGGGDGYAELVEMGEQIEED